MRCTSVPRSPSVVVRGIEFWAVQNLFPRPTAFKLFSASYHVCISTVARLKHGFNASNNVYITGDPFLARLAVIKPWSVMWPGLKISICIYINTNEGDCRKVLQGGRIVSRTFILVCSYVVSGGNITCLANVSLSCILIPVLCKDQNNFNSTWKQHVSNFGDFWCGRCIWCTETKINFLFTNLVFVAMETMFEILRISRILVTWHFHKARFHGNSYCSQLKFP